MDDPNRTPQVNHRLSQRMAHGRKQRIGSSWCAVFFRSCLTLVDKTPGFRGEGRWHSSSSRSWTHGCTPVLFEHRAESMMTQNGVSVPPGARRFIFYILFVVQGAPWCVCPARLGELRYEECRTRLEEIGRAWTPLQTSLTHFFLSLPRFVAGQWTKQECSERLFCCGIDVLRPHATFFFFVSAARG